MVFVLIMDKNGNNNCLEGLECPKCGEHDMLLIEMSAVMELTDNGTGYHTDTYWNEDSYCQCSSCTKQGKVREFRIDRVEDNVQPEEEMML